MLPRYGYGNIHLMFTDTDSLLYEIHTQDLYADLAGMKEHFDFSNYPHDHPLYSEENKGVIGKFKDETASNPILEFVGLRPKMYSFKVIDVAHGNVVREKHRAKGISLSASHDLTHADYLAQLRQPVENYCMNRRIGSQLHRIYTYESRKRALCACDDKRFVMPNGMLKLFYICVPKSNLNSTFYIYRN